MTLFMRPLKPEHAAVLRQRRSLRYAVILLVTLFGAAVVLDHLGCFGYRGDDWARFDGRRFDSLRIDQRGLFVTSGGRETTIHLLGLEPADHAMPAFQSYLLGELSGKPVIVKLDSLQTRDAGGCLLAYIYLIPEKCVNVDLIRAGVGHVDRTQRHSLLPVFEGAEADARKHNRGLWKDSSVNPRR